MTVDLWLTDFRSQNYVMTDGYLASLSWCQAPSRAQDQIFVTVRQLQVCWCGGCLLWQEHKSVIYICCWSLPAQTFSGPSLTRLMTIFHCLRFEIPQPGGPGPLIYIPKELGSFYSPPTTHRALAEVNSFIHHVNMPDPVSVICIKFDNSITTEWFSVEERVVDVSVEGGSKFFAHSSHIFWGGRYGGGTVQEFSWFNASMCVASPPPQWTSWRSIGFEVLSVVVRRVLFSGM
jgi:hypothetical protein